MTDRELMQEVLAQPAQEPVAWKMMPRDATDSMLKAMDECSTEGYDERLYAGHAASVYMAAWDEAPTPPQRKEPEPVVWMYQDKSTHEVRFQKHMRGFVDHGATYETPLYTTPPQRTWVDLTDDEVVRLKMLGRDLEFVSMTALRRFARDIAQTLKEKNT